MILATKVSMKVSIDDDSGLVKPAGNPAITPEYRAARAEREAKREVLATKRIRAAHEKAVALGIVDASGKRLRANLPADMQPGSDRDFGG